MTTTADQLAQQLNARPSRDGWTAKCPAHEDRKASLSINTGDDGKLLLHCHAGCTFRDILAAAGVDAQPMTRTSPARKPMTSTRTKSKKKHPSAERAIEAALWGEQQRDADAGLVTAYTYGDDIRVARFSNKSFAPVHEVPGGWIVGAPPAYPLYRLDGIREAGDDTFIYITEGEKDADNLTAAGLVATTMAGGVGGIVKNLKAADLSPLAGRDVVLLPDSDDPGRECMREVADILAPVCNTVRTVELPDLPRKGDATDWLDAGGDAEDLWAMAEAAPLHNLPAMPEPVKRAKDGRPFPTTDLGNAERFNAMYGGQVRYVGERGVWLVWTGTRWQTDTAGAAMRLAFRTVRGIAAESAAADGDLRDALRKHATKSESAKSIKSMLDLARAMQPIAIGQDVLDRDGWLLNTITGTIDLRTGELRRHDPRDHITKLSPVAYDPDATCPTYDKFISDIMLGRGGLVEYLDRVAGYCLTGDIRHHILPIAFGGGANGKSTNYDLSLYIMGDYAGSAPDSLLTTSPRQEHPTEIMDLQGRRLVIASETGEGAALRINLIKKLTGDAKLKGRFMRSNHIEFTRTHKLLLQTNNRPRVSESSNATWRRLKLVPFDLSVPEHEQDASLPERLKAEAPGILARWVRACLRWQADDFDLAEPDIVKHTTTDYRESEDPLGDFLASRFTLDPDGFTSRAELVATYQAWASLAGVHPMGPRNLYERMRRVDGVEDKQRRLNTVPTKGFTGLSRIRI